MENCEYGGELGGDGCPVVKYDAIVVAAPSASSLACSLELLQGLTGSWGVVPGEIMRARLAQFAQKNWEDVWKLVCCIAGDLRGVAVGGLLCQNV